MAIKIEQNGKIIKVTLTIDQYFNIDALEKLVGGWPEPFKIGPVWVIHNEDIDKVSDNFNEVASRFFKKPVYGEVLAVSALELPPSWDLVDESDKVYTIDEIDSGFVKAVMENAFGDVFDNPTSPYNIADPFSQNPSNVVVEPKKQEYFYNPNKPHDNEEALAHFQQFLHDSYDYIVKSTTNDISNFVVYEDDVHIVKVHAGADQESTLNQVLDLLVEEEEYEKAAVIRDLQKVILEKE